MMSSVFTDGFNEPSHQKHVWMLNGQIKGQLQYLELRCSVKKVTTLKTDSTNFIILLIKEEAKLLIESQRCFEIFQFFFYS